MPLSDSYKAHGTKPVIYSLANVADVAQLALDALQAKGEPFITVLVLAGLLVRLQAERSGDSVENTLELVRVFIDNAERIHPRGAG